MFWLLYCNSLTIVICKQKSKNLNCRFSSRIYIFEEWWWSLGYVTSFIGFYIIMINDCIIINHCLLPFWSTHSLRLDTWWEEVARFNVGANSNAHWDLGYNPTEQGIRKTIKCYYKWNLRTCLSVLKQQEVVLNWNLLCGQAPLTSSWLQRCRNSCPLLLSDTDFFFFFSIYLAVWDLCYSMWDL